MPENSKVHRMADAIERSGKSKGSAIAIAQSKTHQSYQTGKPIQKALFDDPEDPTYKDPSAKGKGPIAPHRILDSLKAGQAFGFNPQGKYEGPKAGITQATLVKPGKAQAKAPLLAPKPSAQSPVSRPSPSPKVGGSSAPIAKPFAPPPGLSAGAGAQAQTAASQRYGAQPHIKAPTAKFSPPMAIPIKKEVQMPSNRSKAMLAVAQKRAAVKNKPVKEARGGEGPCPNVPPLGHYEGGEDTKPIKKAIDEDRDGEEVIKMELGPTLWKQSMGGKAVQVPHSHAAADLGFKGEYRGHELAAAHKGGSLTFPAKGLSGASYHLTDPTQAKSNVEGALGRSGLEGGGTGLPKTGHLTQGSKYPRQSIKESRLDHPFVGKPSATRSKKSVER